MTLKVFLTDKYKEVNDTRIFDSLKARVTVPQAAAHYGVKVDRSGMCCCPFHPDKTPSMKINETYYYCFGCHTTGDVIDFTADCSTYLPSKPRASWHRISVSTPTRRYPLPSHLPVSGRRNPCGTGKDAAPLC